MCEIEIDNDEHNDCPDDSEYREPYLENHDKWRRVSSNKSASHVLSESKNYMNYIIIIVHFC